MTQETATTSTVTITDSDIVRRNIKRELPCRLTDEEFTRVAKQRAMKEAEKEELEMDLAKEKSRRNEQIKDLSDEIGKSGKELRTGYQDRTVNCNEIYRRDVEGTGWIHTIRIDTYDEVERRPATAHETQRYLPSVGVTHDDVAAADDADKPKRRKKKADVEAETDDVPAEVD